MELEKKVRLSASVSCMDLCDLKTAMQEVEASEVSFYHFDVVDGRFNRCFIMGETTLQNMSRISALPIEAHLAVYEPERYVERFAEAGADYIAVHYEALKNPLEVFRQIRQAGAGPVLAYRADTSPDKDFTTLAAEAEWVLKLTVNPGFSGQKIQPQAIEHIRLMRKMLDDAGIDKEIEADGNINAVTIPSVIRAGAAILTGGTSGLFLKGKTTETCCREMLDLAQKTICGSL